MMQSINPALDKVIQEYPAHSSEEIEARVGDVYQAFPGWTATPFKKRSVCMYLLAKLLREDLKALARLITLEMGKPIAQAESEIEKCATICDFFAEYAEEFLQEEVIATTASKSTILFEPLGVILGIMPWNFPFWQVFRFIAPTLMAGNAILLKHASNVSGCALAIEKLAERAGFHPIFKVLLISPQQAQRLIADDRISAVTLTGSESAGIAVGAAAGQKLKKTVLELGGSDPFIVLNDADLSTCIPKAIRARLNNAGQSCIAAKRFIIERSVYERFCDQLVQKVKHVKIGDPLHPETEMGPLARHDLVDNIHSQVKRSLAMGAKLLEGGKRIEREGFYYAPTVLADVKKGMPAFDEETFGPLFALTIAEDAEQAIALANDSSFGLGASLWTQDLQQASHLARRIQSGSVYINTQTVSNIHLPFGGIKRSGYGRELSHYGIKEFVNIKTVYFF
ncbi:MAG: NAD-dependent succinate-semialdehyde dehydrogenase [Parachlamydia sp.]|nr:NAD-dependent succinate-semialdehyde dehydrogenase [Parachlamydia sp.]